jgi:rubrerythrin
MVSSRGALEYALEMEKKSRDEYLKWAQETSQKDAKQLFLNLSHMEERHVAAITSLLARDAKTIELKGFESVDISFGLKSHSSLGIAYLAKILKYAISREQYSMESYLSIASQVTEPEVKKILETLASEEKYHKNLLTQQYERLYKAH